ncbi:SGNH/GDSL hydrolase family protein [Proteiniphilum sp. UBA5384]|jgi:lysophospholipase L1-like esterase|uniref:SGNH/GDSL hydrolase family protein n=1 Tax=Proteiniphilum sp. UBA5384 TaxID=1947279 RepID=UPI0025F45A68|nr:SGNH/GDSL hydrolase family protein [Proteiniphilum sp. UBA5384]
MKKRKKVFFSTLCLLILLIACANWTQNRKKVLIIGDSISIGYTPFVKKSLSDRADVFHNKGNAQHTGTGKEMLEEWLGDTKWDIIAFNWGLWDLCYRHPESKVQGNRDKVNGTVTFTVEQYAANMDTIVTRLKDTGVKLLFITTTVVPPDEAGRFEGDEIKYNNAALAIMEEKGIAVHNLHKYSIDIHKKYAKGEGDVHYTEEGYEALSKSVADAIKKLLR